MTVSTDTCSTSAVSSTLSSPKNRRAVSPDILHFFARIVVLARQSSHSADLWVSNSSLSGSDWEFDEVPTVGDPPDLVQIRRGYRVLTGERQRRGALQRRVRACGCPQGHSSLSRASCRHCGRTISRRRSPGSMAEPCLTRCLDSRTRSRVASIGPSSRSTRPPPTPSIRQVIRPRRSFRAGRDHN